MIKKNIYVNAESLPVAIPKVIYTLSLTPDTKKKLQERFYDEKRKNPSITQDDFILILLGMMHGTYA